METINTIELKDENVFPDDSILKEVLGRSYTSYLKLIDLIESSDMICEWRYYRDGKAWLCKVQYKKRTIIWMSAWRGYMQATVYFPVSKLDLVLDLDLGEQIKGKISSTAKVGKSQPCIFEIRDDEILDDLEKVITLKKKTR